MTQRPEYKVEFSPLAWQMPMPGLRYKAYRQGGRQLRLVEYAAEMEPHWCERATSATFWRAGSKIKFDDRAEVFGPGDGVFIPRAGSTGIWVGP